MKKLSILLLLGTLLFAGVGEIKWKYKSRDPISRSPAVGDDGTIYFTAGNHLYALSPDGGYKWRLHIENRGITSPVIGRDGTIYLATKGGWNQHKIFAISSQGTIKWINDTDFEVTSGLYDSLALGEDGTVYASSDNEILVAIDGKTGTLKWKKRIDYMDFGIPSIGKDGTIYVGGSDDYLYAFDPQGNIKWKFETEGDIPHAPAMDENGIIYFGSNDGYFYALNPDGSLRWELEIGGPFSSSPSLGEDGTIYIMCWNGNFYAITSEGSIKWFVDISPSGLPHRSSPAIGADGTIYVGDYYGHIYAFNPEDGSIKWKIKTEGNIFSSPTLVKDGTLYVGSTDRYLYAIQTDSYGLANSSWPKFKVDLKNSGRFNKVSTPEGIYLTQLKEFLHKREFKVSGYFYHYDFDKDGEGDPNDWIYVTTTKRTAFRLLGTTPTKSNVFGFTKIELPQDLDLYSPEGWFIFIDFPNDPDPKFSWIYISKSGKVYKLKGSNPDNTFSYEALPFVTYKFLGDRVIFEVLGY